MTAPSPRPLAALTRALLRPVDAGGLAAFRITFGALMVVSSARFWARGWIEEQLTAPAWHFTWLGFDWVRPWPDPWMHVHFAAMIAAALGLTLGWRTRWCAAIFALLFTWIELIDVTWYLNHYVLVSLLATLLVFAPSDRAFALAAHPGPVAAGWYALLRGQIAVVYVYAGLTKLNADWLLRAEPLATWLQAFEHLPLVGGLLALPATAAAMSWAGAAFDLTVVGFLLHPRTRLWAFAVAIVFHGLIWLMFPVGIFSFVMLTADLLFFDPAWPRALLHRLAPARFCAPALPPEAAPAPTLAARLALAFGALWLTVQLLVPARFLLYPGHTNWTEQGFRFAWRVMLIEKTGSVEYRVVTEDPPRRFILRPRNSLTRVQYKMMSTQPDLILQYAHHIAATLEAEGHRGVHVYADAWASLNGRPSQRLIDPTVDLAATPRDLAPAAWIVPLEEP